MPRHRAAAGVAPHTVVVYGASGGVGTSTVAAALAMVTQAGHIGGHTVLVDFDSRGYDVLGAPAYDDSAARRGVHHRNVQEGIDVVCYPGAGFDPLVLAGVLDADRSPATVNAVIVDAGTPSPAAVAGLAQHHPGVRMVLVTANSYPAAAAARDHAAGSGVEPDEIVVVEDRSRAFSVGHVASWWGEDMNVRAVARDGAVADVVDAGMLGLAHRPGVGIFPAPLNVLQGCAALPDTIDRRRLWSALHASRSDSTEATRRLGGWVEHLADDLAAASREAAVANRCAGCGAGDPFHEPDCRARAGEVLAAVAHRSPAGRGGAGVW